MLCRKATIRKYKVSVKDGLALIGCVPQLLPNEAQWTASSAATTAAQTHGGSQTGTAHQHPRQQHPTTPRTAPRVSATNEQDGPEQGPGGSGSGTAHKHAQQQRVSTSDNAASRARQSPTRTNFFYFVVSVSLYKMFNSDVKFNWFSHRLCASS